MLIYQRHRSLMPEFYRSNKIPDNYRPQKMITASKSYFVETKMMKLIKPLPEQVDFNDFLAPIKAYQSPI